MQREHAIATQLHNSARTWAGYTAAAVLNGDSSNADALGGFREWQSFLESRITDLAAAVDAGRPGLFSKQVQWCLSAMHARNVSDVQVVKALKQLGVTMNDQLADDGAFLNKLYIQPAIEECGVSDDQTHSLLDPATPIGRLTGQYILAILEGNRQTAASVIRNAVANGMPIYDIYTGVLDLAGREIGRMWQMDEISIAEEHFATTTSQMVMAQILTQATFAPRNGKTLVACCVPGNRHDLGCRLVADLLEIAGWRTIFMGADVPRPDIFRAVIDYEPHMLMLSVSMYTQLRGFELTCRDLRVQMEKDRPAILAGGRAFSGDSHLALQLGADAYAQDVDQALKFGASLVSAPSN